MSQTANATGTSVDFGADQFVKNGALYQSHKRLVDGAAKYDSLDDAKAALDAVWVALREQSENGSGYTPDASLGMGSSNSAEIAQCIIGLRASDATIRTSFAKVGK